MNNNHNDWLLLRGLSRGNGHWGDFPNLLRDRFPYNDIELQEIPGNGTLYKEHTPLNAEDVIEYLRSRSRLVEKKIPFFICAISLGAMIALKWAEQFPEEIKGLYLINSSLSLLSPFYKRLKWNNYFKLIRILLCRDEKEKEKMTLSLVSNIQDFPPKYLNSLTEFSQQHPVQLKNIIRQIRLANTIDIEKEKVSQLPIKIIVSKNDRLVDPSCSIELGKYLKTLPLFHPTAGHDLPLDDPQWLSQILSSGFCRSR